MNERIIKLAEEFMIKYFEEGKIYKSGDMETDIIGISSGRSLFYAATFGELPLNSSPFGKALNNLINKGVITFWKAENEEYRYATVKTYKDKFSIRLIPINCISKPIEDDMQCPEEAIEHYKNTVDKPIDEA